jgi:hypothetical protein
MRSDGRFSPRFSRESGSLCAANRLYPGVDISMSMALPSNFGVDMVATFHWLPWVGSRRMSVMWNPGRSGGGGLLSDGLMLGDWPGLLAGEPMRVYDGLA